MDTRLNKSDYILIAIIYAVSAIFNCIDYYRSENVLIEYLIDIPLSVVLSFVIILIFMYWLIPNYIVKEKKYVQFVVFGLITLCFFGAIDYLVGYWTGNGDWNKFPKWYDFLLQSFFRLSEDAGFVFGILLAKKFYEGQAQFFNVQKQQKENELKLLRSQIDPHFLFNNLNTLDALIDGDTIKAKEYINRLSLIYRYLIRTKDAEVMELSEEIAFAENYIFLIETRFGNDYDFQIKREMSFTDKFIPTGSIQALLENVVKHNKTEQMNTIRVVVSIEEDWLTVMNTKTKIQSREESFGTGLKNLRARYKLLSDQEVQVINTESKFKVSIPILKLSNES
ncbi:histidine kinase [Aquimarina sp. BL5]|uniref:sensor histidine kinase n=1 Tax=Aquimarina sp. BL5 TaxID=1714860 RepID=UPI000E51AA47|nr:histidine kinase [Aquimarina sp. BL5]AXT51464.1 histidine kinase [Aquimarina sp. BL5]RKM93837.1 histidine kinase [Aquimarina sp. BL5]